MKAHKDKRRRGVAVVEMALVAPLLLMLTFGVLQYGWLFLKDAEIADAARIAVRQAVLPSVTNTAQVTGSGSPAAVFLNSAGITNAIITVPTGVAPGTGNAVTVTVSVPTNSVAFPGLDFLPLPHNISATFTMAKEGS